MYAKALILTTLSALAVFVSAQSSAASSDASSAASKSSAASPSGSATPSTASIPPCVLNCTSTAAAQNGCGAVTNVTCVCTDPAFQKAAGACLAKCSAADQQAASQLQNTTCSAAAKNGTASGAAPTGTSPAASGAASSPAASKSAAVAGFAFGTDHLFAVASIALAMVAGATTLF